MFITKTTIIQKRNEQQTKNLTQVNNIVCLAVSIKQHCLFNELLLEDDKLTNISQIVPAEKITDRFFYLFYLL